MRNEHVKVDGAKLRFHFIGKSGKSTRSSVKDRRLARIVSNAAGPARGRRCSSTSMTMATGTRSIRRTSTSTCSEISGQDFTAKDFRTWAGTVLAALRPAGD